MLEGLIKLFTKTVYKVVEVERGRTPVRWDKETREAVASLDSHPGFVALMDRLALQRDLLLTSVGQEVSATHEQRLMRDIGVFWTGWLQSQVNKATTVGPTKVRDAFEEELIAFREIDAQIERLS